MLVTYLNTVTREWFDADGNYFSARMPEMAYQSRETVLVYLKKETPNAGELGVKPAEWPADTELANLPGIGARLTVDSDFIHKLKGTIAGTVNAGSGDVLVNIGNIQKELIPQSGTLRLFDAAGNSESVRYKSRADQGNKIFLFTLEDGGTVLNEYVSGSTVDFDQAPYASVFYNPVSSNISAGIFAFDLVLDSPRLRAEMDYSDRETLPVQGLELLLFTLDSDGNQEPVKAFILDTFTLTGTMGSLENDAPIPDPLKNEIAAYVGSLIPEGGGGGGGSSAGFGTVTASATSVAFDQPAQATVTTSGTNAAKNFAFSFKIPKGADGHTPVKGTDYWTEADKSEIKQYVDDAILNGEW